MDELVAKYLAGENSEAESKELLLWLEDSEDNRNYFHQMTLLWSESNTENIAFADEEAGWNKFKNRISGPARQAKKVISLPVRWKSIAAALVIGTTLLTAYFGNFFTGRFVNFILSKTDNQTKTDTLPDHSVVTLNKKSSLSYPATFKEGTREVTLKGEAFFEITPNKAQPFIIHTGGIQVKVVGTSFNIKNTDTSIEVIVQSGIVQVMRRGETLELHKGEKTLVTDSSGQMKKQQTADQLFNYYINRTFVCDNTPLWKLVEKLNEAYDVHIRISGNALRSLPINVTFHQESLDTILGILTQTLNLKVVREGNNIILQ